MENVGRKVMVSGHVQGVGFRYYTSQEANKLNLTGYAKNLKNGDVEVALYGLDDAVNKAVKWLEKGPRTSRVDTIEVLDVAYLNTSHFSIF